MFPLPPPIKGVLSPLILSVNKNAAKEGGSGFVVGILGDEFAEEGPSQNGLFERVCPTSGRFHCRLDRTGLAEEIFNSRDNLPLLGRGSKRNRKLPNLIKIDAEPANSVSSRFGPLVRINCVQGPHYIQRFRASSINLESDAICLHQSHGMIDWKAAQPRHWITQRSND